MKHTPTYALLALITTMVGTQNLSWGQQEKKSEAPELYTNTYVVPPTFLHHNADAEDVPNSPAIDPFANPASKPLPLRPTAKQVLESYGIVFGAGASAVYNPGTSTLIVRQTLDQMDLVEAVLESLRTNVQNQVFLTYQIIETQKPLFPETRTADKFSDDTPPIDPDSGARGANGRAASRSLKRLSSFAVLTENQLEELIEKVKKESLGKLRRAPQIITRSGSRVEMWVADALTEIDPVIGADQLTIDLNLNAINGRPDEKPKAAGTTQITMWDRQTVALEEKIERSGAYRTRLITAAIVDPAGMPLEKVKQPEAKPKAAAQPKADSKPSPLLVTNAYAVPAEALFDPEDPNKRLTAKEALEAQGVTFGVGASAIFNPATNSLIVRNTEDQIALVDSLVDAWREPKKLIYFSFKEVVMDADKAQDPFSWMMPNSLVPPEKNSQKSIPDEGALAGVFTDPQFQVLIRAMNQTKDVDFVAATNLMIREGKPGLSQINDRRWGVLGAVSADGYQVNVQLFLPKPGEIFLDGRKIVSEPKASVTIWDGQTIVWSERIPDSEKARMIFVTARLVDPSGKPVNSSKVELPEKPEDTEPDFGKANQEAVQRADELALRGSQLMADGDLIGAELAFIKSLRELPEHSLTRDRRDAYVKQLLSVWEKLRSDRIGKQAQTIDDLTRKKAPSLFPEESDEEQTNEFILKGNEALVIHEVTKGDSLWGIAQRYGTTVTRIASANRMKSEMLSVGDQIIVPATKGARESFLETVEDSWQKPTGIAAADKWKKLILAKVEFQDTPLNEALQFLHQKTMELDKDSPKEKRGLNFILKNMSGVAETSITLRLSNVPVFEALRYTTALANCQFEFEADDRVIISPVSKSKKAAPKKTASKAGEPEKDPSDIWYRAFITLQNGLQHEEKGSALEARVAYEQAFSSFQTLEKSHPKFHPELVKYRLQQTQEKLNVLKVAAPAK